MTQPRITETIRSKNREMQSLRAEAMLKVPGYFDIFCQWYEAEADYEANKHTKKSDPGTFYRVRDARMVAQEKLARFERDWRTGFHALDLEAMSRKDLAKRADMLQPERFAAWIRQRVHAYECELGIGGKKPLGPSMILTSLETREKVLTRRLERYQALLEVLDTRGPEQAVALFENEIEDALHDPDLNPTEAEFEQTGVDEVDQEKGYWIGGPTVLDPPGSGESIPYILQSAKKALKRQHQT